ncbi:MAG: hypothetical protein IJ679_09600 [Lachnospiraceae bacterium]|nr:hypothetical protein [Lachnospiraceae bacterium]
MMNVGGYNNLLTDFYAGEIAGRPKAKEDGGVSGRPKAKEGGKIPTRTDSYEPSKAGILQKAAKKAPVSQVNETSEANEVKLSEKAKQYLKNLREANEDFDFFVANGDEETDSVLATGDKEYGVAFSNEELEKMADDEEYAQKMLDGIGMAMDMADRVNEGLDLEGKGISFSRIDVKIEDDGSMSIYAELQKTTDRQKERIEAERKQRAEDRKEAEKTEKAEAEEEAKEAKAEEKAEQAENRPSVSAMRRFENAYGGPKKPGMRPNEGAVDVLRTTVRAQSEEDLFDQIAQIDWDKVAEEQKKPVEVTHFESVI